MNVTPITALAAAVQAQIAAAMDRDLTMMMESSVKPAAGAKATATHGPAAPAAPAAPVETPAAPTPAPPAAASPAQAVDIARTASAGRQASMAPLFADLEPALASSALPAPVKAALRQILALQMPMDRPPTGETVARAVAQSGLFLEAHLAAADGAPGPDLKAALLTLRQALAAPDKATANPAPSSPAERAVTREPASAPPSPARAGAPASPPATPAPTAPLLLRGIDQALVRASAAAPLAADLARALETPALPAPVRAAIAQVLAQTAAQTQPPNAQAPTAQPVASQQPGTRAATPAPLALPPALPPAESEGPPPPELKAALVALRQALASPDVERGPSPPPRAAPSAPPSREAATGAQAPAASSLPDHADAATITQALTRGVEQAVARQTLHQLASLPDGAAQAWMFELPLATPRGTAVAQFEIERDGPGSAEQDGADGWRVRFSIDMEPLGPLHVHLHAGGGRASVNVWAERPESLAPLRSLGGELSRALQAEVRFQAGAPSQPVPQPGRFLDAST